MPDASQQTHNAPTTHPVYSSHQWQDMYLWRPLWSGGLTLILYCPWLLASPHLVLPEGHAEWGVGGAVMSPEQTPCTRPFSECPMAGQFFAFHTILPDHFWERHLGVPCKGDFIVDGMKTTSGAGSPLQKCGRLSCSPGVK